MWNNAKRPTYEKYARSKDVKFFVDGECVSPSMALELAEESDYMADYVIGEEGKVLEIRFDKVEGE